MGRVAIRSAVQALIQGAGIDYVGTVYPARPTILQEADYEQTMSGQATAESANGSACVIVVNLPADERLRRADTGRSFVNDTNIHDVTLELWFASTGGDAVAAQQDYDAIVDALFILVRENPTPGGSTVVWSAGEYEPIVHKQGEPYTSEDGLTVLINSTFSFKAWAWDAGQGV